MTTFRTRDRTLALRCKRALVDGIKITVNYETSTGWSRVTGMVHSVHRINPRPLKVCWDIIIVDCHEGDLKQEDPAMAP